MLTLNKSYLKGSSFKQNLWTDVSSECSGGQWSYSFSERRLFFAMTMITLLLMTVYFTGRVQEIRGFEVDGDKLNSINSEKINEMNTVASPTPSIAAEI